MIRLQPANAEMDPIFIPAGQVAIQGRVLGVLRSTDNSLGSQSESIYTGKQPPARQSSAQKHPHGHHQNSAPLHLTRPQFLRPLWQRARNQSLHEVEVIECYAGHGIGGDRFFDYREDYKGQITFFSQEVFEDVCRSLGAQSESAGVTRRNVIRKGLTSTL